MSSYVLLTLAAAWLHAISFTLAKRLWVYSRDPYQISILSQLACGVLALLALPWAGVDAVTQMPGTLAAIGVCVVAGQVFFILALRHGDASFVVPMLGLKLFAVAGFSALWLGETYQPLVYVGAAGAFASLFLLSDGKPRGSLRSALFVTGAALLYGITDVLLVGAIQAGISPLQIGVYSLLVPALLTLPITLTLLPGRWRISRPFGRALGSYATIQIAGMVFLMLAFGLAGKATIVNIVQTSRGLWVLVVVYVMGRLGMAGVERLTGAQYRKRALGALLLMGSLALAVLAHH
ncbi:MAG: EamA family transporter [Immundisolibacter sp.]|uniref:EamA family transporter n=1 Tax=Immundisolibacter sp. TaxID=1934948 RepID=UPI003EE0027F